MEQLAARWAHNPKVAGSSPASATNYKHITLISFGIRVFYIKNKIINKNISRWKRELNNLLEKF